jgi:hypothetical protein
MKRLLSSLLVGGISLLHTVGTHVSAQFCTMEADCSAGAQCISGSCTQAATPPASESQVQPAASPSVAPPAEITAPLVAASAPRHAVSHRASEPEPFDADARESTPSPRARFFEHGYFSFGALWTAGGTGGFDLSIEDSTSEGEEYSGEFGVQSARGVHIAAYFVPARAFHIGVFVDWLEGRALTKPDDTQNSVDDFELINAGLTLKAGGGAGRAFIGFGCDMGIASLLLDGSPVQRGFWFQPRLELDVMVVRDTPMKAAVFLGLGPAVIVAVGYEDPDEEMKAIRWGVGPLLQVGGSFGG